MAVSSQFTYQKTTCGHRKNAAAGGTIFAEGSSDALFTLRSTQGAALPLGPQFAVVQSNLSTVSQAFSQSFSTFIITWSLAHPELHFSSASVPLLPPISFSHPWSGCNLQPLISAPFCFLSLPLFTSLSLTFRCFLLMCESLIKGCAIQLFNCTFQERFQGSLLWSPVPLCLYL